MDSSKLGVVLSTDMKNTVIVNGETWEEIEELLPKARELYASLIEEFGIKTYGSGSPRKETARSAGSPRTSSGDAVSCADCGVTIAGKENFKTKKFESSSERAGFGTKTFGRPLCMNDQNGCYAKAKSNGEGAAPARRSRKPAGELDF